MKNKPFGLDIGLSTIKAIWLSHENNGYSLNASCSAVTPLGGMLSDSPFDQELMGRTIRKMVADAKIMTPYVNIALPENLVYTKVIEMPVLSDKELSSAIYWEAEQYIPIPLTQVKFDYKVLRRGQPGKDEKTMQVLLVGAPSILIDKYQKVMSLADLSIASAETETLSAIRALVLDDNFPSSLIVNVRAVSTSIAIVRKGIIVFTYSIPVGGTTISRAIAEDFGMSTIQAEEYEKAYGVYDKNLGGKIGKSSEPVLMSIVSEIRKSFVLYDEKFKKDEPIRQIILSGETAKIPGMDLFFAQNCGIETVVANPWKILHNQQISKEMRDNASDYTIAVGLAMRNYD